MIASPKHSISNQSGKNWQPIKLSGSLHRTGAEFGEAIAQLQTLFMGEPC
jgi:hypothetical protein